MLWLFAVAEAINIENNLVTDADGHTALQKLTATDAPFYLWDQHTWGCPVCVLESKVQTSAKGLPKWEPQAGIGVHLGKSPAHAGNVALVLNLSTGYVSPQYHIIFDDAFTLIPALRMKTVPANWTDLVQKSSESVSESEVDSSKIWFNQSFSDPHGPDSGFAATFDSTNHARSSPSSSNEASVSEGDMPSALQPR